MPSLDEAIKHNAATAAAIRRRAALPLSSGAGPSTPDPGLSSARLALVRYREIAKKVRAELHRYAVGAYHRFAFSEVTNAIFDRHKATVDGLLRATADDVIAKIPAMYDRLAAAPDPEAICQAMVSCRRMIAAFADAVCPPT